MYDSSIFGWAGDENIKGCRMAHEISRVNGRDEMFYFGETPWHGLGTPLDRPATSREAIDAAHLDWRVVEEEIQTETGISCTGHKAIIREDTKRVLGIVSKRYSPVQNVDSFGFFDAVVGEGKAIYHTAGALKGGERVWILAKLPDPIKIDGADDEIEKFLLLSNSHNGKGLLRVFYTPIRVVCANTLNMAMQGKKESEGIAIRHIGSVYDRVDEAKRVLGLAVEYYNRLEDSFNVLAKRTLTTKEVRGYFEKVVPDNPNAKKNTRTENIRKTLMGNFHRGRGNDLPGIQGSAWAAYNAVTEWVDHDRTARGKTEADRNESRMASMLFGAGARAKATAWKEAMSLAEIAMN